MRWEEVMDRENVLREVLYDWQAIFLVIFDTSLFLIYILFGKSAHYACCI